RRRSAAHAGNGAGSAPAGRRPGTRSASGPERRGRRPRGSGASGPTSPSAAPLARRSASSANLTTSLSGLCRALASVAVGQADDVVEVRSGDLEDPRVLDGGHAVNRARPEAVGLSGKELELVEGVLPHRAELEPGEA